MFILKHFKIMKVIENCLPERKMAAKFYWKWIFENLKMGRMKKLGDLKLFKNRNFQKNVPIRVKKKTIFKLRVCRGGPREEWCLAEAWAPPLETDLSYFPSHHVTITVTKPKSLLIARWPYCRLRPLKGAIFVNALFRWPAASNSIWLIWLSHNCTESPYPSYHQMQSPQLEASTSVTWQW